MVFPNQSSHFIDFKKEKKNLDAGSKILRTFPPLRVVTNTQSNFLVHEFKSIITAKDEVLYIFMTSKRPFITDQGQPLPKNKEYDANGRIFIPNS
jgi:hypothetical protein